MKPICVLGGGSFGTALAQLVARQGYPVRLWVRGNTQAQAINRNHRNPAYLTEFLLNEKIVATSDVVHAVAGAQVVMSGLPSCALRKVLMAVADAWAEAPLVIGTKGIESQSLKTMHEVACEVLGMEHVPRIVALSGPSFAKEVMLEHPTAVVLAGQDSAVCQRIAEMLFSDAFRAYTSDDIVGVEMGGALKNVMAIAAGAALGLGLGDNSRAALMTRGIAEMTRLAVAKGGQAQTLAGLSGIGDLVLTCTGVLSRNRALGEALGRGQSVDEALGHLLQVAEGVQTAHAAHRLAQQLQVDAPITRAVYRVLYEGLSVHDAVLALVRRTPGLERE